MEIAKPQPTASQESETPIGPIWRRLELAIGVDVGETGEPNRHGKDTSSHKTDIKPNTYTMVARNAMHPIRPPDRQAY